MSFIAGFAAGEVIGKKRLIDYVQQQGIRIMDRDGRPVPIDVLLADAYRLNTSWTWGLIVGLSSLAIVAVVVLML